MTATRVRRASTTLALLLAVLATQLTGVPSADATWPGENGRLAFLRDEALLSATADGGAERRLAEPRAFHADWSPNGRKLVYVRHLETGNAQLVVMNADGSNKRVIARGERWAHPTFSPDGKRVLAQRHDVNGTARLHVMDAKDGSNKHRLAPRVDGHMLFPTWLASGRITYTNLSSWLSIASSGRPGSVKRLFSSRASDLAFSPNGKRVAFAEQSEEDNLRRVLYVMNSDGSGRREVVNLAAEHQDVYSPTWSPDGNLLAFHLRHAGTGELMITISKTDGSRLRSVAEGSVPTWQPRP